MQSVAVIRAVRFPARPSSLVLLVEPRLWHLCPASACRPQPATLSRDPRVRLGRSSALQLCLMPALINLSVVATAVPTFVGTIFNHILDRPGADEPARRDGLSYDVAFKVVKKVLVKAMDLTVEDIQKFGNQRVPSGPGAKAVKVTIPPASLALAARLLHRYFGEDEIKNIVGGAEWWQRRHSRDGGVKAEWIAMTRDAKGDELIIGKATDASEGARRNPDGSDNPSQAHGNGSAQNINGSDETVTGEARSAAFAGPTILYIHGGAMFFGSINTCVASFSTSSSRSVTDISSNGWRARPKAACSQSNIAWLLNIRFRHSCRTASQPTFTLSRRRPPLVILRYRRLD